MIRIPILQPGNRETFPPVETALVEPEGLLAAGGDLSPQRLLAAYRHGIFPWYSEGDPILWWSPDPRMVFATDAIHISTKLRRFLRRSDWTIRADNAFPAVVRACAAPRPGQPRTWITPEMFEAYCCLHALGHAHSVEVRAGNELVGGIYGVALGRMFFAESMFSLVSNGSKVALVALCRALHAWQIPLLDAQVASPHLASLGAFQIPRTRFASHLADYCTRAAVPGNWREEWSLGNAIDLL
ncbi:MAG: leucyl/phenylalanyl-tRNA--protein transferase [Rudaea sp.]|nr:leucyl/phenylalanyl-tRNA--protein transferase [Rudaea sp.]